MLMAMTISACGNQTPQADLAEMQENDTITADAEGQTEYEEAAAEKEGVLRIILLSKYPIAKII